MWNRANSSIKFLDLRNAIFSKNLFFGSDFTISSAQMHGKGFSKLNDKLAMTFFNNKIGQDLTTQVEKSMSRNHPFIAVSFKEFISGFFKGSRTCAAKRVLKPMKETDVSIGNLQNTPIVAVFIAIIGFVFKLTSMKTSLSINNTSKICKMKWIVLFRNVFDSMFMVDVVEHHGTPFVQVHQLVYT